MKYFIQGVPGRGTEVMTALKCHGGHDFQGCTGDDEDLYYYVNEHNMIQCCAANDFNLKWLLEFCEREFLPEPKWEPKRGERILVRDNENSIWKEAIFSFVSRYTKSTMRYFVEGGNSWKYCAPFNPIKLGMITND